MEFGSILFHKLKGDFSEEERDELIEKLKQVVNEFGSEFDEYQFAGLPAKTYPISKCVICGFLTLNIEVNSEGFETGDIYDSISRVVHRGECINGEFYCDECNQQKNI